MRVMCVREREREIIIGNREQKRFTKRKNKRKRNNERMKKWVWIRRKRKGRRGERRKDNFAQ